MRWLSSKLSVLLKYNPMCIFDDRACVCRAWRRDDIKSIHKLKSCGAEQAVLDRYGSVVFRFFYFDYCNPKLRAKRMCHVLLLKIPPRKMHLCVHVFVHESLDGVDAWLLPAPSITIQFWALIRNAIRASPVTDLAGCLMFGNTRRCSDRIEIR